MAPPTREQVHARIQQLIALRDEQFRQAVRRNAAEPDEITCLALRSAPLAARSQQAVEDLLTRFRLVSQRRHAERPTPALLDRLANEQRLLERVIDGHRALRGCDPAPIDANAVAAQELQRRHASEYVRLVQAARRQQERSQDPQSGARSN